MDMNGTTTFTAGTTSLTVTHSTTDGFVFWANTASTDDDRFGPAGMVHESRFAQTLAAAVEAAEHAAEQARRQADAATFRDRHDMALGDTVRR